MEEKETIEIPANEGEWSLIDQRRDMRMLRLFNDQKTKRLISEAVKDDAIILLVDVPKNLSVWMFSVKAECRHPEPEARIYSDEYSFGEKIQNIDRLVLDEEAIRKLKQSGINPETKVSGFPAGMSVSDVPGVEAFVHTRDVHWRFYVFDEKKDDPHFTPGDHSQQVKSFTITGKSLIASIDILNVKNLENLGEDYPELFTLPPGVREILQFMPQNRENKSPRLDYLIGAYEEFWSRRVPYHELEEEAAKDINDEVIKYIFERLDREDIKGGRPTDKITMAEDAASLVLPDGFELKESLVLKKPEILMSSGVSQKFWLVHCLSQIMFANSKQDDIYDKKYTEKDAVGDFKKILSSFNQPNKIKKLSQRQKLILDVVQHKFVEIAYFRKVKFTKREVETAAKICIPISLLQ